jgi:Mn-dependent DtxR family transcriptional regulator
MMEKEDLVTKAERAGIITTRKGSRKMMDLMRENYRMESNGILGEAIFDELYNKTR